MRKATLIPLVKLEYIGMHFIKISTLAKISSVHEATIELNPSSIYIVGCK